ncbi:MAG: DUF192 domain-containing protein [Leptospirales bacterium]|nr:DUF192 domain-containing protein [Leptospirales bacterium]
MIVFRISKSVIFATIFTCAVSYAANRWCSLKIMNSEGKRIAIKVELADTDSKRSLGLMYRRVLNDNEGMLFIFSDSARRSFWMQNTYIPLSIAYISKDGIINEIYDMKPLDEKIIYSQKPAMYALEMKQGWFARNKIGQGAKLDLTECTPGR